MRPQIQHFDRIIIARSTFSCKNARSQGTEIFLLFYLNLKNAMDHILIVSHSINEYCCNPDAYFFGLQNNTHLFILNKWAFNRNKDTSTKYKHHQTTTTTKHQHPPTNTYCYTTSRHAKHNSYSATNWRKILILQELVQLWAFHFNQIWYIWTVQNILRVKKLPGILPFSFIFTLLSFIPNHQVIWQQTNSSNPAPQPTRKTSIMI
jgi:hypothetical protein